MGKTLASSTPQTPKQKLEYPHWISKKTGAIALVFIYTIAFIVGYLSLPHLASHFKSPVLQYYIAQLIMATTIFPFSLAFNNTNVYDIFWFMGTSTIAWFWLLDAGTFTYPSILGVIALNLFSLKHFHSFFREWTGIGYSDFRTKETRANLVGFPKNVLYWIVFSLIGYHWFQATISFSGISPLYYVIYKQENVNPLVVILGFIVAVGAVLLEHISDEQLWDWRHKKVGKCIDTGLWRYSRHPNYFGECAFWTGLFIMGIGCNKEALWTGVGALIMLSLFNFVTLPWMERHIGHKAGYDEYKKTVSRFMFWPRSEPKSKKN